MSDKTDPDQTPAKGKTPDGATDPATEQETSLHPAAPAPRPDEIEDAAPGHDPASVPQDDPAPEAMTAEEAELAAARPGADPDPDPDAIPGDARPTDEDPETDPAQDDAAEAGLDPIASEELREAQDAEHPQSERPDEDFPHGDGSTWPEGRPDELAAGLDSGADYDDRDGLRDPDRDPPVEDDPFHDEHDEHARSSLAARALQALVILLVGAAIALWALPRVAPYLPAPIAEAVQAPGVVTEAELTAMRAEIEKANAARISALETRLDDSSGDDEALTALQTKVSELETRLEALGSAPGDGSGLSQQVEDLSAAQSNLRAQLDSLSSSLSSIGDEAGNLPPEAAKRLSGFAAATDALRAEIGSVSGRVDKLAARLDKAEDSFDERATAAQTAAQKAQSQAADAERRAKVNAAFADLTVALDEGRPYAGPLKALSDDGPAPEALSGPADSGVARLVDLRESFTSAAHDAMEAQATADAGDSMGAKALAALRARLEGVPVDRVPGDGLDAKLGAAAAALREGDLAAALEALKGLPAEAAKAMAPWTERARARLSAMNAAKSWRAELLSGSGN